ncbi:MAG: 2-dehydro-3-deoxygalactonokinase [Pseudomonadota bacterium]
MSNPPVLIALDWGTTNVRAALLAADGAVLEERRGESGVGKLDGDGFSARFTELTLDWPLVPAIAAGMVGSRQGWVEAPYMTVPITPDALGQSLIRFEAAGRTITIVPGLKYEGENRFDVMRGEETQIAGWLALHTGYSGTVVMPGSHSKWVNIEDGVVTGFQTYMTGELFDAVSQHTILRHSVTSTTPPNAAFGETVAAIVADGRSVEGALFGLRAQHLLSDSRDEDLRQQLSALLLVGEIRAAQRDGFSLENEIALIGNENLTHYYAAAFAGFGRSTTAARGTGLVWPALMQLARIADLTDA